MDIQLILRWIMIAIVMVVAIALFGVILKIAGFLLAYALKALLVLLLIAIVLRFIGAGRDARVLQAGSACMDR